jgi:hypothetical protein
MASRTLPDKQDKFQDKGQAIQFGSGEDALYIWPDDRGGINIQSVNVSLHIHPRNGHSIRVAGGPGCPRNL